MCGIVGAKNVPKVVSAINAALLAIQHRAHDFAGGTFANDDGGRITHVGKGHVWEVFDPDRLKSQGVKLNGHTGIGHVRYPTADDTVNGQPLDRNWGDGWLSLAHNGNYTNSKTIRAVEFNNSGFKTGMDSETLVRLILRERDGMPADSETLVKIIDKAQGQLEGSGCVVIVTPLGITVFRDHSGCHPLVYGEHPNGGYVIASEECALTANGIYFPIEVASGTIIHFSDDGPKLWDLVHGEKPEKKCIFEKAYFGQAVGNIFGEPSEDFRLALGRKLADEHPVDGNFLVLPVQSSGLIAGWGYYERMLEKSPVKHRHGALIRNIYAGRMFIEGTDQTRDATVKRKFMPNPRDIRDNNVVLVDDSLVRGTTSGHLVSWLRDMKPASLHFRSAFSPWRNPCRYGIATKSREELAIHLYKTEHGIADAIGVDTIGFISPDGLEEVQAQFGDPSNFCKACYRDDEYW